MGSALVFMADHGDIATIESNATTKAATTITKVATTIAEWSDNKSKTERQRKQNGATTKAKRQLTTGWNHRL